MSWRFYRHLISTDANLLANIVWRLTKQLVHKRILTTAKTFLLFTLKPIALFFNHKLFSLELYYQIKKLKDATHFERYRVEIRWRRWIIQQNWICRRAKTSCAAKHRSKIQYGKCLITSNFVIRMQWKLICFCLCF